MQRLKTMDRKALCLSCLAIAVLLTVLLWPGTDPERTHIVIKQTDSESKTLAQVEATRGQLDDAVGFVLDSEARNDRLSNVSGLTYQDEDGRLVRFSVWERVR